MTVFHVAVFLTLLLSGCCQVLQSGSGGFISAAVGPFPEDTKSDQQSIETELRQARGSQIPATDRTFVKRETHHISNNKEEQPVDPKASGQLLELLVKIAENPATWKQIHRVLETLEANNAAYSKRIDSAKSDTLPVNVLKLDQRLGDKRNDVPEKVMEPKSAASSSTAERAFEQWKEILFTGQKEVLYHPQLDVIDTHSGRDLSLESLPNDNWPPQLQLHSEMVVDPPFIRADNNFETRLKDIELELRKLSKSKAFPTSPLKWTKHLAQETRDQKKEVPKTSKDIPVEVPAVVNKSADESTKIHKALPKFVYHKVHNTTADTEAKTIAEPNFWKRIASLKESDGSGAVKRKTFVAVSILAAPTESTKALKTPEHPVEAENKEIAAHTEADHLTMGLKKCKNKNHRLWKEKQRLRINRMEREKSRTMQIADSNYSQQ